MPCSVFFSYPFPAVVFLDYPLDVIRNFDDLEFRPGPIAACLLLHLLDNRD